MIPHFLVIWSFRVQVAPGGVELHPRRCQEVRGSPELQNGGLRALEEAWDDFLLEAFSCQVCSFSVLLGRLRLVREGVELRSWRSWEVTGSSEFQNGCLRAMEEAWMTTSRLRHFPVKSGRFLCFSGLFRWFQEVSSCVPGDLRRVRGDQSSKTVA